MPLYSLFFSEMAAIIREYICSQEMLKGTTETGKLAIGVVLDCCILVCKVNVMVCGPLCEPQLHRLNVTSRGLKVFADQHVHVVAVYSHLGAVTNTPVYCMFVNTKFIFYFLGTNQSLCLKYDVT